MSPKEYLFTTCAHGVTLSSLTPAGMIVQHGEATRTFSWREMEMALANGQLNPLHEWFLELHSQEETMEGAR